MARGRKKHASQLVLVCKFFRGPFQNCTFRGKITRHRFFTTWRDSKLRQTHWKCFALRFINSHSSGTGVFRLKSRIVYFRFGANMTDASSKIDVRRLKVRDILIIISVHCALPGLVFLVLNRCDQRPSNLAKASSWEVTMCLTRLQEIVNATISRNVLRKTLVVGLSLSELINCRAKRLN